MINLKINTIEEILIHITILYRMEDVVLCWKKN
jgi:hypothetical protein